MTKTLGHSLRIVVLLIGALALEACFTIAPYSETAYQQATTLKADSLALIAKSNEAYSNHSKEVTALDLRLSEAQEYAKGRPNNMLSVKQWEVLLDPNGHSLGGFLKKWEAEGTIHPGLATQASQQISDDFDTISGLESGKTKESKN